jgi:hypothetical protein
MFEHLFRYLVGSGGKYEVVAMQALDLVCPPAHGDLAPFGQQCWMVASGFSQPAHAIGESQGLAKIGKGKDPLQLHDAIALDDLPLGSFGFEQLDFGFRDDEILPSIGLAGLA